MPASRPQTHDILGTVISELGARLAHVMITELRDDVFYARLVMVEDGDVVEVDSRASDAIALALRAGTPIYVDESVLERAGLVPQEPVAVIR